MIPIIAVSQEKHFSALNFVYSIWYPTSYIHKYIVADMDFLCPKSYKIHHRFSRYFCSRFLPKESDCSTSLQPTKNKNHEYHSTIFWCNATAYGKHPWEVGDAWTEVRRSAVKQQCRGRCMVLVTRPMQVPPQPSSRADSLWMTSNRTIPYHKNGKSIVFRKSEIDSWLMQSARKSTTDIYDEARAYVANNPMRRGRWRTLITWTSFGVLHLLNTCPRARLHCMHSSWMSATCIGGICLCHAQQYESVRCCTCLSRHSAQLGKVLPNGGLSLSPMASLVMYRPNTHSLNGRRTWR